MVFEKKSKCLVGKIVHYSGQTVLSVSSNEATISSKVPSALTLKAAQLVGQILALRALESGIHSVYCDYEFEKGNTSKVGALLQANTSTVEQTKTPYVYCLGGGIHQRLRRRRHHPRGAGLHLSSHQ